MSESRGRPFAPGNHLGRGRPRGSRNKRTLALQEMLGKHAPALVSKCVVSALHGDKSSMRICMERILPPLKYSPVQFPLLPIESVVGVGKTMERLIQSMAQGEIPPEDAEMIADVLKKRASLLEAENVEKQMGKINLLL